MIEVKNLTKFYGDKKAVDNISFKVNKGEILGFLGPNGAGKSTTMNMLTGYLSSTSGTVKIGGFDLLEMPEEAKKNIGYLPEVPPLYPDMTVEEYLGFVYELKHCTLPREQHLREICEVTGIDHVAYRMIRNLSKGYRQRVGLAQALIGNPEVIVLDEPTIGLDPKEIVEIRNLVKRLGQTHTVLLSSHILTEIQAVCERVIILNQGYLIRDDSTENLIQSAMANNRYGIRIVAPQNEAMEVLSALPGVLRVEYVGSMEKGTVDLILESDKHTDIRRVLFAECAKRDWYILMITPLGVTLEDIFMQLVGNTPDAQAALNGSAEEPKPQKTEETEGGEI